MSTARDHHLRITLATLARQTEAARALLPLLDYAGCGASIEGDRIAFVGPSGRHSLDLLTSAEERILAHWHGFVGLNGGGWAIVRKPIRGQESVCDLCDAPLVGLFVATDHGSYCSGACAESERAAMAEADGEG